MSPRVGLTAERVVDAARAIADRDGYEALTLQGVAAAVGVRPPSLYNHIAGIGGIRRALHLRGLEVLTASCGAAVASAGPADRFAALCRALRAVATAHPGLYAAAQPSVHLPGEDEELLTAGEQLLTVLLEAAAALGLAGNDALHAVRAQRSAVHGFVTLEAAGAWGMGIDVDESFERLIAALEAGLRG